MRGLAAAQAIIDAKRLNSHLCQNVCLRSDPLETEAGLWPMRGAGFARKVYLFRPQVYERVGILPVKEYEGIV